MVADGRKHVMAIVSREKSLQWRHNGHEGVSNHQARSILFAQPFIQTRIKKKSLFAMGKNLTTCAISGPFSNMD